MSNREHVSDKEVSDDGSGERGTNKSPRKSMLQNAR